MAEKQQLIEAVLDNVVARKGTIGALLVRRDGVCAAARGPRSVGPETLSAMTAVAFGAAEVALAEFARGTLVRFQAESKKHRLVALAATDELLLVAVLEPGVSWDDILAVAQEATASLAKIVAG